MGSETTDKVVEAEMLSTVELESKVVLDLPEKLAQFKGFTQNLFTVIYNTWMFRIQLSEVANYLVSCILTPCFQSLGHSQVHLKCCHIPPKAFIDEFRFLSYSHFNLYSYQIVDQHKDVIEPSGPSGIPLP